MLNQNVNYTDFILIYKPARYIKNLKLFINNFNMLFPSFEYLKYNVIFSLSPDLETGKWSLKAGIQQI